MPNSPASSSIDVGSIIANTYTIEALIGRGGMGAVFLASHKRLPGKQVAIKILHAELSGDEVLARFQREAQIASKLGHPNIVQVHDFNVTSDGTPYLVLEYLHGESLAQRLRRGPLALEHAMSIARQIGSALAAAHREGIVHRDLKPQNIFLVPSEVDGRTIEIAKVLDFGISKIRGSTTVKTQDSALLGTPQYMAPEQALGRHAEVDERTDVFAFGAIVYEMLSGQPAFSGETIPEVVFKVVYEQPLPLAERAPNVPAAVTTAVHRALAKPREERFATVSELVEALTGQPVTAARGQPSLPPVTAARGQPSLPPLDASGRTPNTGNDAFAQTVGSGDHGTAMPPRADPPVRDHAATVTAQRAADQLGSAGTVSAGPDPQRAPRKRAGVIVATIAGVAAVAAIVGYVMTRRDPPRAATAVTEAQEQTDPPPVEARPASIETQAPPPVETPPTPVETRTPPVETQPEMAVAPDAGFGARGDATKPAKSDRNKPAHAKRTPDKHPTSDEGDEADEADPDGDTGISDKLFQAKQALAAGRYDRAEMLANSVIHDPDASANKRMRALVIVGKVQCMHRNDQSGALATLRKLAKAPRLRRQVADACRKAGVLQAPD